MVYGMQPIVFGKSVNPYTRLVLIYLSYTTFTLFFIIHWTIVTKKTHVYGLKQPARSKSYNTNDF